MAWEMVQIRSWRNYWNEYVVKGLQNGISTSKIHDNIIEAMRKEVFGQLMFRGKVDDISKLEDTDENNEIVQSVAKSMLQKFNALLKECRKYKETKDILFPTDFDDLIPREEENTEETEDIREKNTDIDEGA
jgi:hypothetical protein